VRIEAVGLTDAGRVRDGNEDSFVLDQRLALFAVADGMGGHRGGEVASATAIEALRAAVAGGEAVDAAVRDANRAVLERAERDPELAGMGTTMTAAVPVGESALLIAHVGDSRAYRLHDTGFERITDDHSLVEELVREGRLTPEQAESHPQRAIITRALGQDDDVDVDVYTVRVRSGDRIVLCSDGLTTMMRERDIERIVRAEQDPQRAVDKLVDAANEAGGEDNITVLLLDVHDVEEGGSPDPEALAALADDSGTTAVPVTPASPAEPPPAARRAPVQSRRRRVAGVAFVVIPLLFIAAVAFGALSWYDRHNWYLAADGGQVVLYRGRPDALLWDATRQDSPRVAVRDLTPQGRRDVEENVSFDSRRDALQYLDRVTATTSAVTTSTTRPRATTSVPRRTTTTRARARATSTTTPWRRSPGIAATSSSASACSPSS
jgi:protein phosphatase